MSHSDSMRLLIVEESDADAQAIANELRLAGHDVHHSHAGTIDAVTAILDSSPPDIVICGSSHTLPSAEAVVRTLASRDLPAPVISIADSAPETAVATARKAGISELVSYEQPEHLRIVFAGHAGVIALQRRIARLEESLRAGEARCHALISKSSDPTAYIHDGMHVYANASYLELFGIASPAAIEGTTLLDIVSEVDRDGFRDFLKAFSAGTESCATLDIHCSRPDGGTFRCTLECGQATMDGEHCTQIIIRDHASPETGQDGLAASRITGRCLQEPDSHPTPAGGQDTGSDGRTEVPAVIRDAVEQDRIFLEFQPILSLKGDTEQRYEVIAGFRDAAGDTIQPDLLHALAGDTRLERMIDRRVVERAFEQLADLQPDAPVVFFIRLSAASVTDPELPAWIGRMLERHRLESGRVVFEIPTNDTAIGMSGTSGFADAMHGLHCSVALEHFGDGDSAPLHEHFPADILKIDGALIRALTTDSNARETVRSIVEMAAKNRKTSVAESVEDSASFALLWKYGVDCVQGQFIQEPGQTLNYVFASEIA